jgi:hypothetical protein
MGMGLTGFKARSRWSVRSFARFVKQSGFAVMRSETLRGVMPFAYVVAGMAGDDR